MFRLDQPGSRREVGPAVGVVLCGQPDLEAGRRLDQVDGPLLVVERRHRAPLQAGLLQQLTASARLDRFPRQAAPGRRAPCPITVVVPPTLHYGVVAQWWAERN